MSRRSVWLKRAALSVLLLFAVWLLAAWQLLPRLLQSQAESLLAERGHSLSMQRPHFDPLRLRLELSGLELRDAADAPLLQFARLVIDVSSDSLWRRALVLDDLELVAGQVNLQLLAGGGNNWTPLLDSFPADDEPPSLRLPRLEIRHLAVREGVVDFADQPSQFATRLTPLNLELSDLTTLADEAGQYQLSARSAWGGQIDWRGQAVVEEVGVQEGVSTAEITPEAVQRVVLTGTVKAQGLALARLTPLLASVRPELALAGELGLSLDYAAHYSHGQFDLELSQLASEITGLQLDDGLSGLGLRLGRVALDHGRYQLASQKFALDKLTLQQNRLLLSRQSAKEPLLLLDLQELAAEQLALDLAEQQLTLQRLGASGGRLAARRLANGSIDVAQALTELAERLAQAEKMGSGAATGPVRQAPEAELAQSGAATAAEAVTAAGQSAEPAVVSVAPGTGAAMPQPWRYHLGQLALEGFAADWLDQSVQPAARLGLRDLGGVLQDVSADLQQPLPLALHADVASGGRLELAGSLVPATGELQAEVKLSDLALAAAQPYLSQFLKLQIASGNVSLDGQARYAAGKPHFKGGFSLRRLRLDESEDKHLLLGVQLLSTRDLQLDDRRLTVGTLMLNGLDTKLHIAKDKSLNLSRLVRDTAQPRASAGGAATPASKAVEASAAPATGAVPSGGGASGFIATIERLRIRSSALDFSDASLALPFGTRIHGLRGVINGLSTQPGRRARVELEGQVDEFGQARAVGQLDVSDPSGYSDIKVVFRNVAMSSLTPYAATFAGRKIESGKLSLDLDYQIKQRQLSGDNQVVIDQLVLGARVDSPEASDLPLDLALALLQDGDGRIDLGLPVSGSLDDPQFSIGGLVWKVFTNVITKLVTAPFRALAALFGGGESFDAIVFDAGSGKLNPPEQEKLRQLAGALQKRPALQLMLAGAWSPVDKRALQERDSRVRVAQLAGLQDASDASDPGPLSTTSPAVQQALEKLYAERLGKERLAALKAGFRAANPGQLEATTTERLLSRLSTLVHEPQPLDAQAIARLAGADFHGVLFAELASQVTIADERLHSLAQRRAQAVQQGLVEAGVGLERLPLMDPRQVEVAGNEVPMAMELQPAAAPGVSAAPSAATAD